MKEKIIFIYCQPISSLLSLTAIILLSWTIICLTKNRYWVAANHLFVPFAMIAILLATVAYRVSGGEHGSYPIPLDKLQRALIQPEYYREMFMNCLLFVPFGMTFPYLFSEKRGSPARVILTVSAALILSALIELLQYCLNIGSFETDDILCNAFGALVGSSHLLAASLLRLIIGFFAGIVKGKDRQ